MSLRAVVTEADAHRVGQSERGLDPGCLLCAFCISTWCSSREWACCVDKSPATSVFHLYKPNILVQAVGNGLPNGTIWLSLLEIRAGNITFTKRLV